MSRQLTPQEEIFVEHFMESKDPRAAVKAAGIKTDNVKQYAGKMLARTHIQEEIKKRQSVLTASLMVTEQDVIAGLLKEAQDTGPGTSQSGRINAWIALGKHLGMFESKKEGGKGGSGGTVYNIVQYNNSSAAPPPPTVATITAEVNDALKEVVVENTEENSDDI